MKNRQAKRQKKKEYTTTQVAGEKNWICAVILKRNNFLWNLIPCSLNLFWWKREKSCSFFYIYCLAVHMFLYVLKLDPVSTTFEIKKRNLNGLYLIGRYIFKMSCKKIVKTPSSGPLSILWFFFLFSSPIFFALFFKLFEVTRLHFPPWTLTIHTILLPCCSCLLIYFVCRDITAAAATTLFVCQGVDNLF